MPLFRTAEKKTVSGIAREAEAFAKQIRTIPVSRDADRHPELRQVLASFKRINKYLSQRDAKGEVTLARRWRVGREFQRLGTALRARPARRAVRKTTRKATRKKR